MQRRRVADPCEAEETRLALLAQPLESRQHLVKHLGDAERLPVPGRGDRIVQVKDIDPVEAQPRKARFERLRYSFGNATSVRGRQPDLGADYSVGRLKLLQDPAEIFSDSPLPNCTAVSK